MRRILFISVFLLTVASAMAQTPRINIVGTWDERIDKDGLANARTWIFRSDGTIAHRGRMKVTYPIGGVNTTFDLIRESIDEKWSINDNNGKKFIDYVGIPQKDLKLSVDYNKYQKYTPAQQQKIKAALPAFIKQGKEEAVAVWQRMVGHESRHEIIDYSPTLMFLSDGDEVYVLERNTAAMTPTERAAFEKEVADFEKAKPSNAMSNSQDQMSGEKIYEKVGIRPSFPGGNTKRDVWMKENVFMKYSDNIFRKNRSTILLIQFVVEKDGRITNIKIRNRVSPSLEKETISLVSKMPNWNPGKEKGQNVRSLYVLPYVFDNVLGVFSGQIEEEEEIDSPDYSDDQSPIYEYETLDEKPSFPGGMSAFSQWVRNNMHYPEEAYNNGIQGRVIIQFVIDQYGTITNIKVKRSVDPSLDKEAIRVVKAMPKWIPGKKNGKNVRTNFTMPLNFSMQ